MLQTISKFENDEQCKYIIKLEQEFVVGESIGRGGFGQIIKVIIIFT